MTNEPLADDGSGVPAQLSAVAQWISAARQGSLQAFDDLFAHCRGYLLAIAGCELPAKLRDKTNPSDIVQMTIITAQRCFARFEGTSERDLLAWMRGILLRQLDDMTKFYHRAKRDVGREVSLERDLDQTGRAGLMDNQWITPGQSMIRDEEAQRLLLAMAALPSDYHDVIVLRNWELLSFDAVGERMQRSGEAARKLWGRAIESLRRELEQPRD